MRIKRLPVLMTLEKGPAIGLQIASALRDAIAERRLSPREALPSSRDLAKQLGVARNTVLMAIAQLVDEGLLETRPGVGTFVRKASPKRVRPSGAAYPFLLTDWARRLPDSVDVALSTGAAIDLRPGLPDLRAIPFDEWRRSAVRKLKTLRAQLGSYGTPEGHAD